jgi:hypothetical protein
MNYPLYRISKTPGEPSRFICVASPNHAVDVFETTDPHNHDPLGFEYRILRSRPTVKRCEAIGAPATKEEWFAATAEMMLTHLGSIGDLVQLCDSRRDAARRNGAKADYAGVIEALQEVKPSRRAMVRHRIQQGSIALLG